MTDVDNKQIEQPNQPNPTNQPEQPTAQNLAKTDLADTDLPSTTDTAIYQKLAAQLAILVSQVTSFAKLYDDGASVPFIARYRKNETGGLDDEQLRQLEQSLTAERALAAHKQKIKDRLIAQNVFNKTLALHLDEATSKLAVDDIYQPYRPQRHSLAYKARLAGLDKIAEQVLAGADIEMALADFVPVSSVNDDNGEPIAVDYATKEQQMAGVSAVILDMWATHLDWLDKLRQVFNATAVLHSSVYDDKKEVGEKFRDYFDHNESFAKLSSHRLLAMLRGRQQNILKLDVIGDNERAIAVLEREIDARYGDNAFLKQLGKKLWQDKWQSQLAHRLLTEHHLKAQNEAIAIFANNLEHLLMTAPAGRRVILGVDPGYRHGIKMAVIDDMGDVLATDTVYPFTDSSQDNAKAVIVALIQAHKVDLVAIGNGTASRETKALIDALIVDNALSAQSVVVSEAGASVYSASEIASSELPDLDVSLRGAVSIARRLQDPLSELVKVPPKTIGVGQYQHDVNQSELEDMLAKVTEDCVNKVGVDVNTASPSILAYIAGLNKNVAEQIVNYRRENGAFNNRDELKNVPRLGAKTFEQAAGFLRIKTGNEPLDSTGVHPESYAIIYDKLALHNLPVNEAIGNGDVAAKLLENVAPLSKEYLAIKELTKDSHDPRGVFRTVVFAEGINSVDDLSVGMVLEGVVTNVTAFGCFVDIGVHQDGLVHISELKDGFVASPSDVVKPYDIVKVRVIGVDVPRSRISLSIRQATADQAKQTDGIDSNIKPSNDRPNAKNADNQKTPDKTAKSHRPQSDKRSKTLHNTTKTNAQSSNKQSPNNKPKEKQIGSLGLLLQQMGVGKN